MFKNRRISVFLKIFGSFFVLLILISSVNILFFHQFSKVSEINNNFSVTYFRTTKEKEIADHISQISKYIGVISAFDLEEKASEKNEIFTITKKITIKAEFAQKKTSSKKITALLKETKQLEKILRQFFDKIDTGEIVTAYKIVTSKDFNDNLIAIESLVRRIPDEGIDQMVLDIQLIEKYAKKVYYQKRIEKTSQIIGAIWNSISDDLGENFTQEFVDSLEYHINILEVWDKDFHKSRLINGVNEDYEDNLDKLSLLFIELEDKEQDNISNVLKESTERHQKASNILIFSSIFMFVIVLILSLFLADRISSPIHRLRNATYRASLGKYDQRLKVTTRDEVGGLVEDFNSMMEALSNLDEMKNHFMAKITHDLKSPLNRIKQRMANIEDGMYGTPPEWLDKQIEGFYHDLHTLLNLVHNHLDLQKIDIGRFTLNVDKVNMKEFLRSCVEKHVISYQKKGVGLSMRVEVPEITITIDHEHMFRVFDNLLTNALKYSTRGDIVRVICQETSKELLFIIEDEGPGIPDNRKKYVFDRFYQVPGTKTKGTGLGLTISREIVEAHNGRIFIKDGTNGGSRFIFTLPKETVLTA